MLQLQVVREEKDKIIAALQKRNIDAAPLLEKVLQLDEKRRTTQSLLDNTLAESNKLSKEIGMLFKSGKAQEANVLKEKTGGLKEDCKGITGFTVSNTEYSQRFGSCRKLRGR